MQGAEGEVAGLGNPQCGLNRFKVSHFADEHHVGIFTKGGSQGVAEGLGIGVHLALVYQAILVLVHELDRIFDGDDVIMALSVDLVEHRRQSCRLARAGGTGDQNQPAWFVTELGDDWRQVQLIKRPNLEGNDTEYRAGGATLVKQISAESGKALET